MQCRWAGKSTQSWLQSWFRFLRFVGSFLAYFGRNDVLCSIFLVNTSLPQPLTNTAFPFSTLALTLLILKKNSKSIRGKIQRRRHIGVNRITTLIDNSIQMKNLSKNFKAVLFVGLVAVMSFATVGCKKNRSEEPTLPPSNTFVMDFSEFGGKSLANPYADMKPMPEAGDMKAGSNWGSRSN